VAAKAGFRVRTATRAADLLEACRERVPDVILLDLQMPDMDGIETLRALADAKVCSAIVLLTGMDSRTTSSAEQYGASRGLAVVGTLQKPFLPEELAVHYQPTARRSADGGWEVTAVEALLRWNHPR